MNEPSELRVTMVSTPDSPECGVGTYTGELTRELTDEVTLDSVVIPVECTNPLVFLRAAFAAGRSESDIIHVQHEYGIFGPKTVFSWIFFPVLYIVARLNDRPILLTVHEAWSRDTIDEPVLFFKWWYVRAVNALLVRVADELVFLSDVVRDDFSTTVEVPTSTRLPHGVSREEPPASTGSLDRSIDLDPNDDVVVQPGYVSESKGQDVLVQMARDMEDVEFLIAGGTRSDRDAGYVDRLTDSLPANVTYTGVLEESAFHDAFRIADAVVLPYRKDGQSGVVNWCAAHEVPIAGSNCAYFKRIAQQYDCIELFDIDNREGAIRAVNRILKDGDRRAEMVQALRKFKREESFQSVAKRHVGLYRQTSSDRVDG